MVKLSEIINSQQSLNVLLGTSLPVKIAYQLSKLVNKIQPDLKIYDEQRMKLVKELGEQTDAEKDLWTIKPENMVKYTEEMAKLLDVEVDINLFADKPFEKIKIEDLGDINVEAKDLVSLDWLIV